MLDIAGVEGFEMQGKSLFGGSSRRNAAFSRTFMNQMVYQGVHTDEFRYIDIQRDKIRVNALRNEFVTTLQA
ncbi:MAG: hypothetical protein ABEI52_11995, partial [Halobacteriaceae archaeon]